MKSLHYFKPVLFYCILITLFLSTWSFSQDSSNDYVKVNQNGEDINPSLNFHTTIVKDNSDITKTLINKSVNDNSYKKIEGIENDKKEMLTIRSTIEDRIEITLTSGEQMTQTFTIQNTKESPLIWNVLPEGSENLIYRKYIKDRFLSELISSGQEHSDDIITSEVFDAKKIALKLPIDKTSKTISKNYSEKINRPKEKQQDNESDVSLMLNDENVETSNYNKVSEVYKNSDRIESELDEIEKKSKGTSERIVQHSHHNVISEKENNGNKFEDKLQEFRQWYHFADCGYPTFDPKTEIWEVSQDNGEHWLPILTFNGESYVLNAECFNPIEFLENSSSEGVESLYSDLTSLDEFVKNVEYGPSISPTSGIIPANSSMDIKFEVNATSFENGVFNPKLVVIDALSMETVEVIPLRFNVRPESEKDVTNTLLSKENNSEQLPDKYELSQNFPNPFNPSTRIKYSILADGLVTLKVYDVLGSEVTTLVNENKEAGFYEVEFNAASLANGVYFYRLQTGDFVVTKKMVLLK